MSLFKKAESQISISTETIIKSIGIAIAAYLLLRFIDQVSHQLTLIAVSFFLALALNPAVTWIMHRLKSKSRLRAAGAAYVIVLTLLIGFLSLVVPPLVRQTVDFSKDVPSTIRDFKSQDNAASRFVDRYDLDEQLSTVAGEFGDQLTDANGPLITTASRVGGTIVSVITVLILTFMMLIEGPVWYKHILGMYDDKQRKHYDTLAQRMYRVVTGYVNGQVLIAAIAAFFAMVAMMIASTLTDATVNVVALTGIVFIFGLIPLIGNIMAASLVVLFALFESVTLAVILGAFFILYQQIENSTLQPYIQSRTNQLTPLIVFVAALVGAGLGGLIGALAAIPVAGCIRVLIEDKYGIEPIERVDVDTTD